MEHYSSENVTLQSCHAIARHAHSCVWSKVNHTDKMTPHGRAVCTRKTRRALIEPIQ